MEIDHLTELGVDGKTLQNKLKQPQYKMHTKWNSHNTIKYPQYKVTWCVCHQEQIQVKTWAIDYVQINYHSQTFYTVCCSY
jgi:hypothetical protein